MTDYIHAEGQTASESVEQQTFFQWAEVASGKHPELRLMYHVPNEGKRSALYIELKAGRNKPTADQLAWLAALDAAGNKTAVCWGWQAASKAVVEYLGG